MMHDCHVWGEAYDGYMCRECGLFLPYGSEPWMPYDPDLCPEAYYGDEEE